MNKKLKFKILLQHTMTLSNECFINNLYNSYIINTLPTGNKQHHTQILEEWCIHSNNTMQEISEIWGGLIRCFQSILGWLSAAYGLE